MNIVYRRKIKNRKKKNNWTIIIQLNPVEQFEQNQREKYYNFIYD